MIESISRLTSLSSILTSNRATFVQLISNATEGKITRNMLLFLALHRQLHKKAFFFKRSSNNNNTNREHHASETWRWTTDWNFGIKNRWWERTCAMCVFTRRDNFRDWAPTENWPNRFDVMSTDGWLSVCLSRRPPARYNLYLSGMRAPEALLIIHQGKLWRTFLLSFVDEHPSVPNTGAYYTEISPKPCQILIFQFLFNYWDFANKSPNCLRVLIKRCTRSIKAHTVPFLKARIQPCTASLRVALPIHILYFRIS